MLFCEDYIQIDISLVIKYPLNILLLPTDMQDQQNNQPLPPNTNKQQKLVYRNLLFPKRTWTEEED